MDDLISRQAAIMKILGQPPELHYPSWYAEQIKEMPSARPERKKGEWKAKEERKKTRNIYLLRVWWFGI